VSSGSDREVVADTQHPRPAFTGIAHLAVVVRDLETSCDWYERVLGFERTGGVKPGPVEAGHPRQATRHHASGMVLVVHEPIRRSNDLFDASRTGLDHISVTLSAADIEDAARRLDQLGVENSGVRDLGYAHMVTFSDPDGIAWEFWAAPAAA
jgi:glyoxylase I family protein